MHNECRACCRLGRIGVAIHPLRALNRVIESDKADKRAPTGFACRTAAIALGSCIALTHLLCSIMDKYRILSKKGEGTFSEVLKCQNKETGDYVAIKHMKSKFQR